jgi:Domain of unknown function (DUF3786)
MTDVIDDRYFEELAAQNPDTVCRRNACAYDPQKGCYLLSVWGDSYAIAPQERRVTCLSDRGRHPHAFFYLFIIYYLLRSKYTDPSNTWISEKDIPGGATFFRGPHAIPTEVISNRYGNDIDAFKRRCEQLSGAPLQMGDAAYRFWITERIPVAVLYWKGDDEFRAEAGILYDKTIGLHLTPDIIFALAVEVCLRIGKPAN